MDECRCGLSRDLGGLNHLFLDWSGTTEVVRFPFVVFPTMWFPARAYAGAKAPCFADRSVTTEVAPVPSGVVRKLCFLQKILEECAPGLKPLSILVVAEG